MKAFPTSLLPRLAGVFAAAVVSMTPVLADDGAGAKSHGSASVTEEERVREVVRDYLLEHPEVIIEALEVYRERERAAEAARLQAALESNRGALYDDAATPVAGNPEGDVTIVEFFDYHCGYCKRTFPGLMETVEKDGNIRLVLKEFPILGPQSIQAARAALAAHAQGRYMELHMALMEGRGTLSDDAIMAIAKSVGLDLDRLEKDMRSPEVDAALAANAKLAKALSIGGTPAFVVSDKLVPGALPPEMLRELVAEARGKS